MSTNKNKKYRFHHYLLVSSNVLHALWLKPLGPQLFVFFVHFAPDLLSIVGIFLLLVLGQVVQKKELLWRSNKINFHQFTKIFEKRNINEEGSLSFINET